MQVTCVEFLTYFLPRAKPIQMTGVCRSVVLLYMRSSQATVVAIDNKRKGKGHMLAVFTQGNCGAQTPRYHEEASPTVSVLCIWRKQEREKNFTLVLLSGDTWFKLTFLMLCHGIPPHVHIDVCCPVSANRIFGKIYYLIQRIHADITPKTSIFEHLFDCDRTCAHCRQHSIF
jgi:hypothetical protein